MGIAENEKFNTIRMSDATTVERQRIIHELDQSINLYDQLRANMEEGQKFYADLQKRIVTLQQTVRDHIEARKLEKRELELNISRDATLTQQQTADQELAARMAAGMNIHQAPAPVPATPSVGPGTESDEEMARRLAGNTPQTYAQPSAQTSATNAANLFGETPNSGTPSLATGSQAQASGQYGQPAPAQSSVAPTIPGVSGQYQQPNYQSSSAADLPVASPIEPPQDASRLGNAPQSNFLNSQENRQYANNAYQSNPQGFQQPSQYQSNASPSYQGSQQYQQNPNYQNQAQPAYPGPAGSNYGAGPANSIPGGYQQPGAPNYSAASGNSPSGGYQQPGVSAPYQNQQQGQQQSGTSNTYGQYPGSQYNQQNRYQ